MVVLVGSVLFVQKINDQTDNAQAQAKDESRKHGMPPLDNDLVGKYRREVFQLQVLFFTSIEYGAFGGVAFLSGGGYVCLVNNITL